MGAVAFLSGCGGTGTTTPSIPDAGVPRRTLELVGVDSLGLAFGQRTTLTVRLRAESGQAVAGARVDYAIAAELPGESPGGATLSTASASSAASGEAAVDVVAGAARASFRVVAGAEGAPPVSWSIAVSDAGFAALDVAPRHIGVRDTGAPVEVRLYSGTTRCAELSAEAPAPTHLRAGVATAGTAAAFDNLLSGDGYAVLAWSGPDGAPAATGCVDLAPRTLRAGGRVRLAMPVVDRPLATLPAYLVASTFDLAPLRARVLAAGAPWARAACPLGAAELLLDCAIDALDGTGAVDCVVEAPGALAEVLQARRGASQGGCRTATAGDGLSLDAAVMALLAASDGSPADALAGTAALLGELLDSLSLESTLALDGPSAAHVLGAVSLSSGGALFTRDLRTTARPVLSSVAAATRASDSDQLDVAIFGFTLRLGDLVAAALRARGALDDVDALGQALVAPAGCAQVSAVACALVGEEGGCLAAACAASLPALDGQLAGPFALIDGEGLDFFVEGGGVLVDGDGDRVAEQLLGGTWTATARLAGGEEVAIFGAFQARQP